MNVSDIIMPYINHCTDTKNDITIKGKGKLSEFLILITCKRLVRGAAKKQTVTIQHTIPKMRTIYSLLIFSSY